MIRWFALSGQGWRHCTVAEGVLCFVDTPAYGVGLGAARLVAHTPGEAGCACVPDFDFMSVGPAVTLLVPGGFDRAPMGWMQAHHCQLWGRWSGGWCRHLQWNGHPRRGLVGEGCMHLAGEKHAHHCCLHLLEGLRKLRVGCDKVVDSNVLFDWRIGEVVERCSDLVCLVLLLSSVGAKYSLACRHVVDVVHFGKGCHPVGFPGGPGVVGNGMMVPLAQCHGHVATRQWWPWWPWRWVEPCWGQAPGSILASLCRQPRVNPGQSSWPGYRQGRAG